MEKPHAAIVVMDSLKDRGIKISIDDFGTGYSSLAYLNRFSAHSLKIDGSFIRDVPRNPENMAIVSAIVSLARNLGIKTIAEGVETEDHIDFLREIGCTTIEYGHVRPDGKGFLTTIGMKWAGTAMAVPCPDSSDCRDPAPS